MAQQLSLSARPRSLDALVGQKKVVDAIRGHAKSGRMPKAWLFVGPKGSGKTSLARILALSLQCEHQEQFGVPCKACRLAKAQFPIHEINAASVTGIDKLREELAGSDLGVLGNGKYRVYILDELHQASDKAQDLALKYLEDTPESTVFIINSTRPDKIVETLRSRCIVYELRELEHDDILVLVTRLLKLIKSNLPPERLADALVERGVRSPRLIAQATEKYLAGCSPADAVQVDGATEIDIRVLTRAVVKGDWTLVSQALLAAQGLNIRAVRMATIAYLRSILLEEPNLGSRASAVAKAIEQLASVQYSEDTVVSAMMAASMYRLCDIFSKYKH